MLTSNRNLRLLIVGQFISALGDQFYLIAIPWLALQMTGRALIAGSVLAVAGIPRALAMLLGGAASDRFSAKSLLVGSNGIQGILMLLLGLVVLLPTHSLWLIFVLAFATGLVDAFGLPALNTLLPQIVQDDQLEDGNLFLQGTNMVSGAIGPALAALLITFAATMDPGGQNLQGIGLAFLINAFTFLLGISIFWRIRPEPVSVEGEDSDASLLSSFPAVIEFIRSDSRLSYLLILMLTLGLFLTGTIRVGFALLADAELSGNVQDLGNMTSAFGAGVLVGMIGRRLLPKPPARISGLVALSLFATVPLGLILLGLTRHILAILAIILAMGLATGYIMIFLLSWLQLRTPHHLLGRVMAIVFFTTIGLSPISQILMGYLLDINLRVTFVSVGVLMLAVLILTASNRSMWSLETSTDRVGEGLRV